jgi:hypothetical protein
VIWYRYFASYHVTRRYARPFDALQGSSELSASPKRDKSTAMISALTYTPKNCQCKVKNVSNACLSMKNAGNTKGVARCMKAFSSAPCESRVENRSARHSCQVITMTQRIRISETAGGFKMSMSAWLPSVGDISLITNVTVYSRTAMSSLPSLDTQLQAVPMPTRFRGQGSRCLWLFSALFGVKSGELRSNTGHVSPAAERLTPVLKSLKNKLANRLRTYLKIVSKLVWGDY